MTMKSKATKAEHAASDLEERIKKLEAEVFKPCEYEARALPWQPVAAGSAVSGTWCKTHGWNCPKAAK